MAAKEGLTPRQKAFADEYLCNGGNAYRAALAAGYRESTAHTKSYQLLEREDVAAYIAARRRQMAKRAVTPERVLLELAAIGFADATDYAQIVGGRVVVTDTGRLSAAARRAIAGIKEGRDGVEVKLADKVKALELMGKNLGLFRDKVDITRTDTGRLADVLAQLQDEKEGGKNG